MIAAAAIVEAIAIVVIVAMFLRAHAQERARVGEERQRLLDRIQRPELIPVERDDAAYVQIEPPTDEWNLVGTIAPPPGPEE